MKQSQFLAAGRWRNGTKGQTTGVVNPANDEIIGTVTRRAFAADFEPV